MTNTIISHSEPRSEKVRVLPIVLWNGKVIWYVMGIWPLLVALFVKIKAPPNVLKDVYVNHYVLLLIFFKQACKQTLYRRADLY